MSQLERWTEKRFVSQPKAFWILSSMEAFEAFSFYGLSSLIILFMSRKLGFSEASSISIFALFMVMSEFFSLIGGFLADRLFGLLKCLKIGGYLMLIGYCLVPLLPGHWFLLGLGFIVIGNALFASNTTSLLGLFYGKDNESSRDPGFVLYYASLNVGAFISLIACGLVVEKYDWKYAFILAALGMIFVVFLLWKYNKVLSEKDIVPHAPLKLKKRTYYLICFSPFMMGMGLYYYNFITPVMPFVLLGCMAYFLKQRSKCTKLERQNIGKIFFLVLLLTLFFAVAEQVRSSLIFFASSHVETILFGWQIPLSSLPAMNPIMVVFVSPLLSLCISSSSYEKGLNRILFGFMLLLLIFAYLWGLTRYTPRIELTSLFIVIGGIALAELLVGPVVYSLTSKLSPKHLKGAMMGVVTIGYAAANHLAGHLAHLIVPQEGTPLVKSIEFYRGGFQTVLMVLGTAIIIILAGRYMRWSQESTA